MGTKVAGEEGYQVLIGGGSDDRQGLGRELIPAIRFADLPPLMERFFHAFLRRRRENEPFIEFTRRHTIEQLQELISSEERG